jgi:outer membrane murein-binding lipoprotein Lpp
MSNERTTGPNPKNELQTGVVRLWWLNTSEAARTTVDLLHFGSEKAERMAAALVVAALFFLAYLAVAVVSGVGPSVGAGVGGAAFVVALVVSGALILPLADAELNARREKAAERVAELRLMVADVEREEAELRSAELAEKKNTAPARAKADRNGTDREKQPSIKTCPYCMESIPTRALKCRYCGEIVDESLRRQRAAELAPKPAPVIRDSRRGRPVETTPKSNPGVAAALSFFIPGLGQIYRGRVLAGFIWFFATMLGYSCLLPGFVLHVLCVFSAAAR